MSRHCRLLWADHTGAHNFRNFNLAVISPGRNVMEKVIVILTSHRTVDVERMIIITRSYSSSSPNRDDIIQEQRTVDATLQIPSHLDDILVLYQTPKTM